MKTILLLTILLLTASAYGQDDINCPPKLEPMVTTRIPDFDVDGNPTGRLITVSEADTETRMVVAAYDNPYGDYVGTYTMDGTIDFTNKSTVRRKMRFRQSILLDEGIMPIIPPAFSEVCWEPSISRLIVVYEQVVAPGETIQVPIFWEITTRLESQLADVNSDGVVDAADQGLLMAAFGTSDPLYDLNQDGVVDGDDLGILLSQWSESSDDVIEEANAGGGDDTNTVDPPIEGNFNPLWETADYIIAADIQSDPLRGGNGQVRVPFLDWQWRA